MKMTVVYLFIVVISLIDVSLSLIDVTNKVFGSNNEGLIAAFGDFNADKHTDIFAISGDGKSIVVYFAGELDKEYSAKTVLDNASLPTGSTITSVVPADFDGDVQTDLLVTTTTEGQSGVSLTIFWGQGSYVDTEKPLIFGDKLVDQPLLLDENGDMIPDLMGETAPGQRFYWICSTNRTCMKEAVPGKNHPPLHQPQSSAFVDLNNDLTADMCIVSTQDGVPQLEYWINQDGKLTLQGDPIKLDIKDKKIKVVGQFAFDDIDGNQMVDVFVPVCFDIECAESAILLYFVDKWIQLPVGLSHGGQTYNFIPPAKSGAPAHLNIPITLRVGDFNLDGYTDLLAVLGNASSSLHTARLLYNEDCGGGCEGYSRTFRVDFNTMLEGHSDVALLPAFFDLNEDGILDVLVSSMNANGKSSMGMMQHKFVDDACFMKVLVVSGRCHYNCPANRQPYGVNQPGPSLRYRTTDLNGNIQTRIATQLTQSAYLPLQLPFSLFGLGQTPNFIEEIEVGIPSNTTRRLTREWTQVIPNSQIVVIPYPVNKPESWKFQLFVMPSRLMLYTGASLLGTCGFIAGIVAILHWRDKVEDKKEKRQEAQKFHFDAM